MKISIVGFGRMGQNHFKACKLLKLDVVNIIDKSKKNLDTAKKLNKSSKCIYLDNYNNLFKTGYKFDCLIISTTTDYHFSFAKIAIKNKIKKILIEKPLCNSINECKKLIFLKKKYNVNIAVNHQMRYMEKYIFIKKLFQRKDFGKLSSVNIIAGNCGLAMNASHFIEGFRFITSEKPDQVSAWLTKNKNINPRGSKFNDYSGIIKINSQNNKTLLINILEDNGNGIVHVYTSDKAIVTLDDLTGKISVRVRKKEFSKYPTNKYALPSVNKDFKVNMNELITSTAKIIEKLKNGKKTVTPEDALINIKTITGAYLSSLKKNKNISLKNHVKNVNFNWP